MLETPCKFENGRDFIFNRSVNTPASDRILVSEITLHLLHLLVCAWIMGYHSQEKKKEEKKMINVPSPITPCCKVLDSWL